MAEDSDDKTEDPTQKRLDDAHAKGDVAKSQEVNTWFIIAGATLILSTFSSSVGGGILTPLRNLIANAGQLHADGAALLALGNTLGYAVLGATARVTLAALSVAGSVIAQQLGLGFVTSVDPTQGQQGLLIGNFLTILGLTLLFATDSHHLVIAALNESYRIFSPGELLPSGDVAALATRAFAAAFKIGMQLSAPFLVFGLVFNIGLGVLARLMPAMQVYFVGVPLSIMVGFLIFAFVLTGMMATFLNYFVDVMHQLTPLK